MLKNSAFLVLALLILGIIGLLTTRYTLFSGNIPEQGQIELSGIKNEVQLGRYQSGRVHISAQQREDGVHALGFVHARDRLWQLQRFKWAGSSRWASVFGDAFLSADELAAVLLFELQKNPEAVLQELSAEQRRLLESYAAGINAYIENVGWRYPLQFSLTNTRPEPWDAADVLRTFGLQQWLMQTQWQQELAYAQILPDLPDQLRPYLFEEERIARLGRMIPSTDSTSKAEMQTLLRADRQLRKNLNAPQQLPPIRSVMDGQGNHQLTSMQSGPQAFGYWYAVSLEVKQAGGDWQMSGFSLPGTPLFWAATNEEQRVWTAQHGFESEDLIIATGEEAASGIRQQPIALLRADSSQILRHVLIYDEARTRGFRLGRHHDGDVDYLFRRPEVSQAYGAYSRSMWEQASKRRGAAITRENEPEAPFRLYPRNPEGAFELAEGALDFELTGSPQQDSSLVMRLSNPVSRAFLEEQVNRQRLGLARRLAQLIEPYTSVDELKLSYDYLVNWDGRYDRHAVAASIVETSLLEASRRSLRSYISEQDFQVLEELGLISTDPGRQLINTHLQASEAGRRSPVDDAFFARRVVEAVRQLRAELGEEPYMWRWSRLYQFQYGDLSLCEDSRRSTGGPDAAPDIYPASFSGSDAACKQIILENIYPVSGQADLINAALAYPTSRGFEMAAVTSGFLQTVNYGDEGRPGTVRLLQLPGYAGHPFSAFYGNNSAPDLSEPQIARISSAEASEIQQPVRTLLLLPE